MPLSIGKRDIAKIAAVIDSDEYESAEQAAEAVIEACFDLYESKARWALAGQIKWRGSKPYIDAADEQAAKVIVGPFGTETQARNAARQLTLSSQTGEEFRVMVCEFWHGTPAAFYKRRNEERKAAELAARSPMEQEIQRRLDWFADNPGALTYEPNPTESAWKVAFGYEPGERASETSGEETA